MTIETLKKANTLAEEIQKIRLFLYYLKKLNKEDIIKMEINSTNEHQKPITIELKGDEDVIYDLNKELSLKFNNLIDRFEKL